MTRLEFGKICEELARTLFKDWAEEDSAGIPLHVKQSEAWFKDFERFPAAVAEQIVTRAIGNRDFRIGMDSIRVRCGEECPRPRMGDRGGAPFTGVAIRRDVVSACMAGCAAVIGKRLSPTDENYPTVFVAAAAEIIGTDRAVDEVTPYIERARRHAAERLGLATEGGER